MIAAEALGIHRAQLRVIAAAALAYIVVQGGDIEQFRRPQAPGHPAGDRKAIGVLGIAEAARVLDDFQGVGVHGIGVKQVVLHLADDAAELGQVFAQDAVAAHASQLPRQLVG